jgi:hypothetical protein
MPSSAPDPVPRTVRRVLPKTPASTDSPPKASSSARKIARNSTNFSPDSKPISLPKVPSSRPSSTNSSPPPGTFAAFALWKRSSYSRAATCSDLLDDDVVLLTKLRLARHKSRIERTLHRSLKELKALQTNAALRPLIAPQDSEALPLLASSTEIAKRTQDTPPWMLKNTLDPVDLVWASPDSVVTAGA